jgi:hypothetical protein
VEEKVLLSALDVLISAGKTADHAVEGAGFPTQIVLQIGRENFGKVELHLLLNPVWPVPGTDQVDHTGVDADFVRHGQPLDQS